MIDKIEFKPEALADLEKLAQLFQERTLRKIRWLAENFDKISPQALTGDLNGLFKLKVGDYRVIYSFSSEEKLITIHQVGHRRDVYN